MEINMFEKINDDVTNNEMFLIAMQLDDANMPFKRMK